MIFAKFLQISNKFAIKKLFFSLLLCFALIISIYHEIKYFYCVKSKR